MKLYELLLRVSVVVDEVDKEVFDVEKVDDCPWDMYPRPLNACAGAVGAAYLADLVLLEEVELVCGLIRHSVGRLPPLLRPTEPCSSRRERRACHRLG